MACMRATCSPITGPRKLPKRGAGRSASSAAREFGFKSARTGFDVDAILMPSPPSESPRLLHVDPPSPASNKPTSNQPRGGREDRRSPSLARSREACSPLVHDGKHEGRVCPWVPPRRLRGGTGLAPKGSTRFGMDDRERGTE